MPGHRCSARLKEFDYDKGGVYFITVCINERKCMLGDVQGGKMILNEAGMMVDKWWQRLPGKFNGVAIDQYCIMPNHIHAIIRVVGLDFMGKDRVCQSGKGRTHGSAPTITLGRMVQWFKTMSTNEYIQNVKTNHWAFFNKTLWQRSFHDHVIRSNADLMNVYEYIATNPSNWATDDENPDYVKFN